MIKYTTFKVVNGDFARMTDHLVVLVHVGGPEVDEDVDDEHDVDGEVDDGERVAVPFVGVGGLKGRRLVGYPVQRGRVFRLQREHAGRGRGFHGSGGRGGGGGGLRGGCYGAKGRGVSGCSAG